MFHDNLQRENAFQDHKNKKLKNSKNWDFPKGLVPSFGQKLPIFPSFYFRQNRAGNMFYDILETKPPF